MLSKKQNIELSKTTIEPKLKCNIFLDELLSVYKLEKKLNENLPTMILEAENPRIANGFTKHLKFTQAHLKRLEILFKSLGQPLPS